MAAARSSSRSRGKLNWLKVSGALIMALACLFILYQLWLFCMVVWYAHREPGSSAMMRQARLRPSPVVQRNPS